MNRLEVPALLAEYHAELLSRQAEVREQVARARDDFAAVGVHVRMRDEQLPLTPALLLAADTVSMGDSCRSVLAAIEQVAQFKFDADPAQLLDFVRVPQAGRELALFHGALPSDWAMMARPDLIMGPEGIRILETNIVPNLGHFPEAQVALRAIMGVPVLARMLSDYGCQEQHSIAALAQYLKRRIPGLETKLLALADWDEYLGRFGYVFRHLAHGLNERGLRTVVCAAELLSVADQGIFLGETPVDVLYRFFGPPAEDDEKLKVHYEKLLEGLYGGGVHVIGDLGHTLLTAKAFLALVSDEEVSDWLAPEVRRLVPWTRIVEARRTSYKGRSVDLLPFVESHKDLFVLKASLRSGGNGTAVGRDLDGAQWRARISEVLASDEQWVIQEWVDTEPAELAFMIDGEIEFRSCHLDYGVFMFNQRLAGAVRRNTTRFAPRLTHAGHGGGAMAALLLP